MDPRTDFPPREKPKPETKTQEEKRHRELYHMLLEEENSDLLSKNPKSKQSTSGTQPKTKTKKPKPKLEEENSDLLSKNPKSKQSISGTQDPTNKPKPKLEEEFSDLLSINPKSKQSISGAQDPTNKSKPKLEEESADVREAAIARVPDHELSSVHLTREDLNLSQEERMEKMVMGFMQAVDEEDPEQFEYEKPKYCPDDPLPKGYDWASFTDGTGHKDFIVHMDCFICGVGLDHWPQDCPKAKGKGTDE